MTSERIADGPICAKERAARRAVEDALRYFGASGNESGAAGQHAARVIRVNFRRMAPTLKHRVTSVQACLWRGNSTDLTATEVL